MLYIFYYRMRRYQIRTNSGIIHVNADSYRVNHEYLELYKQSYPEPLLVSTIKNWEYILDLDT